MISIEKKKSDKVDFVKPLSKYIKEQYSEKHEKDHLEALNGLSQLREDTRNSTDKSDTIKDLIYRYYTQLTLLELRFPISDSNVKVSFPWYDIYKNKKTALYSIHYEKASVLFNYAALLSQLGALQNRTAGDGLKASSNYFQLAAGAFAAVKEYTALHPECNGAADLVSDSLAMLVNLMLAQAQACFCEKAVKDAQLGPALLAKLIAQASEYFDSAVSMLNSSAMKSTVDRAWAQNVELWALTYKALAQYRMSIANSTVAPKNFGEQVARLQIADRIMTQAKPMLNKQTPPELKDIYERHAVMIQQALSVAQRENNTIYHETVPEESRLAVIDKKSMVKALPLPAPVHDKDPFASLIPFQIKEAAQRYKERKDDFLRKEMYTLEDNNAVAQATLSSMGLPAAVEALEAPSGIPAALKEKMEVVKREGGARLVLELSETLANLSKEDLRLLETSSAKLDEEERDDNNMRASKSNWSRAPSHQLTTPLRAEAAKYRTHIDHAMKSDTFINKKFLDNQQYMVLLSGTSDEVLANLPASSAGQDLTVVAPLKKVLGELDAVISLREKTRDELNALSSKDDIAMILLGSTKAHEDVYTEELKKYEPLIAKLRETYMKQEHVIATLNAEYERFKSSRSSSGPSQREKVLQSLTDSYKAYSELKTGLSEGIKFYTDFQDILVQFNKKCEEYVSLRAAEKQEILHPVATHFQQAHPSAPPPYYAQPSPPGYKQQPPPPPYQASPSHYQYAAPPANYPPNPFQQYR